MRGNRVLPLIGVALLAALPALGQTDQTGLIEGRVASEAGTPIDEAIVQVARADGSYPRTASSADDGSFRIAFVPPGSYDVAVEAPGYVRQVLEGVRVGAARTATIRLELKQATEVTETVTVVAQAPLIETGTTEVGLTLSEERVRLLPTSREATSLVQFTPGARTNQVWGGSTTQANAYQLDGVNVTDPGFGGEFLLPNIDWIEEFQVRGLGAGAEYGNFTGGLVNIVTKSGSNTFSGAVRVNYETASLNSDNLVPGEVGEELDQRFEINAGVGGPLIRDKLYYYVSAQQVTLDTSVVDTSVGTSVEFLDVQEERTETKVLGKLTWQATQQDTLNFLFGIDNVETDNRDLNSIDEPATATEQDSPGNFWNASWQRIFGPSNFLEVKLTGFEGDDDRLPLNGALQGVQFFGGGNSKAFRNQKFTRFRTRENRALAVNWDSFVETGGLEHHLKIGGEYNDGSWVEQRLRTGGITWRPEFQTTPFDPENPATWEFISSDWGGEIGLDADVVNSALFVQDYLQLSPAVSLNFGLRLGRWEGELHFRDGSSFEAMDDSAIDPRVGISWDVGAAGTWVVKGHWGRYHQNMFALFFDRACDVRPDPLNANATVCFNDVFQDEEFWDWIGDAQNPLPDLDRAYTLQERDQLFDFFDSVPIGDENGPVMDYEQPYVDQWVLSVERALGERWKVGLSWVDRDWKEILALVDNNLESNYTRFENLSVIDFATGFPVRDQNGNPLLLPELFISNDDILFVGSAPGLTPAEIAALTFDEDFVLTNAGDATREMKQLQLTVHRRGRSFWLNGSLVWTDLEGNFFSVNGYEEPDGIGAGAFVRPNETINFLGNMPNHAEWEAKVSLGTQLPWEVRFGAFVLWDTGDFYTPFYEIDRRNHDFVTQSGEFLDPDLIFGISGQDVFLERRGNRELDSFSTVDLHFERPFRLNKGLVLSVELDVFNLFDSDAVTALRRFVNDQDPDCFDDFDDGACDATTVFGSTRARQPARTLRIGTTLSW